MERNGLLPVENPERACLFGLGNGLQVGHVAGANYDKCYWQYLHGHAIIPESYPRRQRSVESA